ncbi:hypothetical protein DESPIG_00285 [Desulfovibrio piger ATCC 29098]|uniref:Uncharacterized protein n=1 Tax=Desulfovibrio piger ATCC 29098 TaxID=411464 RepID=B6WQC8_9BACT|nr:hypothetical protein DESPIG_00285 [Desulfovibrio piger ATCC 29098]
MGRGGRGKPFGKGLPLPPRAPPSPLPKLFIQVHGTVSQRLGQPSRSGPPVLWRGCTPEGRASLPCRHVRVGAGTVFRPGSAKRFPEGCGNGHGAGTGPAETAQGLALPCRQCMAVAKTGPAFWASGAWRAAARHSEQSGQILRYGLPQIKKISVFCGQGPVTAPASFAGGEGQVRANSRTAAARDRWAGSESGEKRDRGEGRARPSEGKDGTGTRGQAGMPHRAAVQKAPVS